MCVGVAPRTNEETRKLSKQVRKYFIDCEKQLQQQTKVPQLTYDEQMMLQAHRQILDGNMIGYARNFH